MSRGWAISLATVAASFVLAPAALANTYTPNTTADHAPNGCSLKKHKDCTLREAVISANAHHGSDKIVLGSGKTYSETIAPSVTYPDPRTGSFDVAATGGPLAITTSKRQRATVRGFGTDAIFEAKTSFSINRLVVKGGNETTGGCIGFEAPGHLSITDSVIGPGQATSGGDIFVSVGSATISHTTILGGTATGGGGIDVDDGGTATISASSLHDNLAQEGGGIQLDSGGVTVNSSTITENIANIKGGGVAAVSADSSGMTLNNTRLTGNTAPEGGGAYVEGEPLTLSTSNSTFSSNSATNGHGGGIFAVNAGLSIRSSSFRSNKAQATASGDGNAGGGAIAITGGANVSGASNSTFYGNTAAASGGAVDAYSNGSLTMNNDTVSHNQSDTDVDGGEGGGGLHVALGAVINLGDSIVLDNNGSGSTPVLEGDCEYDGVSPVSSGGHNLVDMATPCVAAGTDIATSTPGVAAPATNGGATMTMALAASSPALNHGAGCTSTDQRGVPRSLGGHCDIGAYERVSCHNVLVNRVGTGHNDTLSGTSHADGMLGLGGKDKLRGKGGNDALCGGTGKDKLIGGAGHDYLDGGPGHDTCITDGHDHLKSC